MPTCNLDYLFELSDPLPDSSGSTSNYNSFRLKENVILAYQREPSSGGIFILKPNSTDYEHIQRIIYEKENRVYKLPYPHWDPEIVSTAFINIFLRHSQHSEWVIASNFQSGFVS
jgi:hypothetical protein